MGRIRKIREDVKKVVTYKFVISRSAVQFRPLAPYKTMAYRLRLVGHFVYVGTV